MQHISGASSALSGAISNSATTDLVSQAESDTTISNPTHQPTSYVLKYFKRGKEHNKCQFVMVDGNKCGKNLAHDKTGSTTLMKNHLESKHGVRDSKLPSQSNILAASKKVKTGHVVSLKAS